MKYLMPFFLLFISAGLIAQTMQTSTLTVNLNHFKTNGKQVHVGLYIKNNWLKKPFMGKVGLVQDGTAQIIFNELPLGEYAISCFYDINSNDDLDSGFMGIPKEPYAFSNNAKALFGSPSWEKASFTVSSNKEEIFIEF